MPQPRRYECTSWDLTKKQGVAIDGTKYEGEFIEFIVRGVDLDPDYKGHLIPGEEFYANESPNHLLYDVVVETGPRGLISQTNFEAQQEARREASEPASMVEHMPEILSIINDRPAIDYSKLSEPVTMSAEEFAAHQQTLISRFIVAHLDTQAEARRQADTETPAPGEKLEEVDPKDYPLSPRALRAHLEHLESLLTNLKRETNLIVAYLDATAHFWRGVAGLEQEKQLERLGISVARPEPIDISASTSPQNSVEKVDEFSSDVDDPSPEASGQAL